jgi:hypothetical protein
VNLYWAKFKSLLGQVYMTVTHELRKMFRLADGYMVSGSLSAIAAATGI